MPAFVLPDLGEGLTEAEIVTWHVQVGDTVAIDQKIVEVETAKAIVEVPVPFAGIVTRLHAGPSEVVAVGAPLVTVTAADETRRDRPPSFAEPGIVLPAPAPGPDDVGDSGSVLVGYGTSAGRAGRRRARAEVKPAAVAAESRLLAPAPAPVQSPAQAPGPLPGGRVPVASPIIRKLARDVGVEVGSLRGSGAGGLVTRRDVEAAIVERKSLAPADGARIPLRGALKAAAEKFSRSRREIPEATVWVDVDATELVRLRATFNADETEPKITMLALLSRFAILGLERFPELNSRIEGDEIVLSKQVHLGFAAQTSRGLVVPVLANAQALTLEQLSRELSERTRLAHAGGLAPADMTGGTFTVNNYGVFGVDGSAAIINHPEVAILGIGRIIERPWVVAGAIVPRHTAELTLAFDHRACDGRSAGGFLRFVADCFESPAKLFRHL